MFAKFTATALLLALGVNGKIDNLKPTSRGLQASAELTALINGGNMGGGRRSRSLGGYYYCPYNSCLTNLGMPWYEGGNGTVVPEVIMAPCGLRNRPFDIKPQNQKWEIRDARSDPDLDFMGLLTDGYPVFQIVSAKDSKCVVPYDCDYNADKLVMADCDGPEAHLTYWMGFTGGAYPPVPVPIPGGVGGEINLGCYMDEGEWVDIRAYGEAMCTADYFQQIPDEIVKSVRQRGAIPNHTNPYY